MTPPRYRVDIYWSVEDEAYLAEAPDLPGCVTHGPTVAEAARNAEEAIRAWIELAKEAGDAVPAPSVQRQYSGRFVARIPRELHARLATEAERQGVSMNQHVVSRLSGGTGPAVQLLPPIDATQDDPLRCRLRAFLESEARGRASAKTTDQIAAAVGLAATREHTRVRSLIRCLVLEDHVPVIGTVRGYFVAEGPDDIAAAARSLARRKRAITKREHLLALLGQLAEVVEMDDEQATQQSILEVAEGLVPTA